MPPLVITKPIALVGMMGTGKSTIGRKLSRRLNVQFFDSDKVIEEREGLSVVEIFDYRGEEYFLQKECEVIPEILDFGISILSTGGNSFINPKIRDIIKDKAISIWIKSEPETLYKRISRRNTRPHFNVRKKKEILEEMIKTQHPIYAQADIIIETKDLESFQVTDSLILKLEEFYRKNPS